MLSVQEINQLVLLEFKKLNPMESRPKFVASYSSPLHKGMYSLHYHGVVPICPGKYEFHIEISGNKTVAVHVSPELRLDNHHATKTQEHHIDSIKKHTPFTLSSVHKLSKHYESHAAFLLFLHRFWNILHVIVADISKLQRK